MSIDYEREPRMPQPEQWMSEHPFLTILISATVILVLVVLIPLGLALS